MMWEGVYQSVRCCEFSAVSVTPFQSFTVPHGQIQLWPMAWRTSSAMTMIASPVTAKTRLRRGRARTATLISGRGLLFLGDGVAVDQRQLGQREDEGERHDAEHLEADPHVGREIAPDDLVQRGEEEKEQPPAEGELAPAFLGQLEDRVEDVAEERTAEEEPAEERSAEQAIDDGR